MAVAGRCAITMLPTCCCGRCCQRSGLCLRHFPKRIGCGIGKCVGGIVRATDVEVKRRLIGAFLLQRLHAGQGLVTGSLRLSGVGSSAAVVTMASFGGLGPGCGRLGLMVMVSGVVPTKGSLQHDCCLRGSLMIAASLDVVGRTGCPLLPLPIL